MNINKKEWVRANKKRVAGMVGCAFVLLLGVYFLFIHNRVSTTPFRVMQSDMEEERFYDYVEENGAELSFSLQSPGILTDEVKEALLDGRDELDEGIYTWVDEEYEETHVVLVGEADKVSGIYGVHREGDDILIGWSSEDWQTDGPRAHIVHLVIDEMLDDSSNRFHLVDVDMSDEVAEQVMIPTGVDTLSEEEVAEIEASVERDRAYSELMTSYFSSEFGLTFEEWQGLPNEAQVEKAQEAGFDSLVEFDAYLNETVAPEYNISIDDELDELYQRYFGRSMQEMAELDGEAYREVIESSAISQEEFQEMVNDIIDAKEGGL